MIKACVKLAIDSEILRKLIMKWIIDHHYIFNEIEAKSFHKIIEYLDMIAISKFFHNNNTIHSNYFKYFKEIKLIIKKLLSITYSQIHLSFNLFISLNCKVFLAIIAYWIFSIYKIKVILLVIREFEKKYITENII